MNRRRFLSSIPALVGSLGLIRTDKEPLKAYHAIAYYEDPVDPEGESLPVGYTFLAKDEDHALEKLKVAIEKDDSLMRHFHVVDEEVIEVTA